MDIKSDIEAIIYLSKEIVTIEELAKFFKITENEINEILDKLKEEYRERGINFVIEDGNIFLKTNPLKGEVIKNFFTPELKLRKLSKSSFEVLAIIAYKGPITKQEIEEIRSSGVEHIIPVLLEKKLIKVIGRKKVLGNPNLYEITDEFLAYIGLKNKDELYQIEKSNWLINNIEKGEENENK